MKFLLSDDQVALQEAVRDFAVEQADGGVRRAVFDGDMGQDPAFWRSLMDLGVAGIAAPADYGGMGLGLLDLSLAMEALGYAGAPGPVLGHVLAILAIAACGSEAQKANWLPALIGGERIGAIALAEADDCHEPARWQTRLADGRLEGEKRDILAPELADVLIVGTTDGFALVERAAPGMTMTLRDSADRTRRSGHIVFAGTAAEAMPASAQTVMQLFDAALILVAADAFGGACRLLDMSVGYAREREQFGGPIGRFQGLKHQLADMAVDIEPARGLYWYAAHAQDAGADDAHRTAALAKAHLGDIFMRAARTAIEAHGGIGFTWEYDAQIWFKRALFDSAWLGTPSYHRERAARLAQW